ncbi:methyltransferase domain-containing protein [Taibaiella koreensis]|uniref:methyltransferase domain-containing protein n=1 Tax=Taibaiella koreensis TaxID=1268548 RepID=UPI000E59E42E|nr:methyltransferase domain-containing protein [Taibaiella koreensis]
MPWNPETYNKFKGIRYRPFFDLADLIEPSAGMNAIDIGCGTGEQTSILVERFKEANFIGIDSSAEMLREHKSYETDRLHFSQATTEEVADSGINYDLIFSNAALQWSDDHRQLFPKLIKMLNPGGQLAIQMPVQQENLLNKILLDLVGEEPFRSMLNGWRRESPVLDMDTYAQLFFDGGLTDINIMQKVYPIIADSHDTLYDFISGSALVPYMERLEDEHKPLFTATFKERIAIRFPKLPAIYAFKRLLLYGKKPA